MYLPELSTTVTVTARRPPALSVAVHRNVTPRPPALVTRAAHGDRAAEPAGQLAGDLPLHGGRVEVRRPGQPEQHPAGHQHGDDEQRADQRDPAGDPRVLDRGRRRRRARDRRCRARSRAAGRRRPGRGTSPGRRRPRRTGQGRSASTPRSGPARGCPVPAVPKMAPAVPLAPCPAPPSGRARRSPESTRSAWPVPAACCSGRRLALPADSGSNTSYRSYRPARARPYRLWPPLPGGPRRRRPVRSRSARRRRRGDLAEQVEHLLAPADEVAGGQLLAGRRRRCRAPRPATRRGPSGRRPRRSRGPAPGSAPARAAARPPPARPTAAGSPSTASATGPRGQPHRRVVGLAARLVDQRGHGGGQLGRAEPVPDAPRRHSATSRSASVQIRASMPAGVGDRVVRRPAGSRARSAARRPGRTCGRASWCGSRPGCAAPSVSRSSRACRSAQRACSSRSAQPWHGCWRSSRAQLRELVVVGGRALPGAAPRPPARSQVERCAASTARSRRACGERWLKCLGTRTRASASTGVGKSPADEPAGPPVLGQHQRAGLAEAGVHARVEHHRQPGPAARRHPDHVAGPQPLQRRQRRRPALRGALPGQRRLPVGDAPPRSAKYSSKSPRWQVIASRVRRDASPRCAAPAGPARPPTGRPGTARTSDSSSSRAALAPTVPTRLTAMLYDGRKLRPQRVGAGRGEPGDVPRVDAPATRARPRGPRRRCRAARPGR